MKDTKRIAAVAMASAMALSLAACGQKGGTPSGEEGGTTDITVCLDWTPNTNHTGLFVAEANGYFEEAGLNVTIVQPPEDGTTATTLCAAGQVQFAVTVQDNLAAAFAREDPLGVTAVAALLQHNTSGLISLTSDGINTPKDLEGKTYATWENPVEQATIQALMEADGGDYSKLTLIPSTVTNVVAALNTDIDTVWIFYAWDGIATELAGLETNFMDFAKLDSTFDYYTPVIFANNTFLEENPETARAFLAATAKGYEYAAANPSEAADILLEYAPELDSELVHASQEWISEQYIADASQWGYIDPARWDGFYTWLTENNLIDGELLPGTGYTNDYLPAAEA